jgi:O-antigen ligase/polysaccharide polymerase Wzy-like membrane protein
VALAALHPPPILRDARWRTLDICLLLLLSAAVIQIAPMPRLWASALSPAALNVERAFSLVAPHGARPLTIDLHDSVEAVLLLVGGVFLFLTVRTALERGGVRALVRTVAIMGLVLSALALAQNATARGLMYWRFAPLRDGPDPFGPFANRNHFSTWAMMAVPLCAGYLVAHAAAHPHNEAASWRSRLRAALDGRTWMLAAASVLLIVATAASLSRSGLGGLGVAMMCAVMLMRRRAAGHGGRPVNARWYGGVLAGAAAAGVLTLVGPGVIAGRFGASRVAVADRLAIWHDTLPILRDFRLTGTGLGTFQAAMAVYQRSKPEVIFNQAHNHYLQVAAEGGFLVSLPLCLVLGAFVRTAWVSLDADRSPMYFIRAGAAAGLIGVAVQSFWETGLTLPADAALAAVLAAILVHAPPRGTAAPGGR